MARYGASHPPNPPEPDPHPPEPPPVPDPLKIIALRKAELGTSTGAGSAEAEDINATRLRRGCGLWGNEHGPVTPTPTATPTPQPYTYTVQAGETLSEIAARFGLDAEDLRRANGLSSNRINADQRLLIPVEPPETLEPILRQLMLTERPTREEHQQAWGACMYSATRRQPSIPIPGGCRMVSYRSRMWP